MNKAIIIGTVGKDGTIRKTASGVTVQSLRVATSERYNDKETTYWHNIVVFGKRADVQAKTGGKVFVEGRIQTRSYEKKDGTKDQITEIVAETLEVFNKEDRPAQPQTHATAQPQQAVASFNEEDIPF